MWLSEGQLRRSSERHICAEKLFAKVRKSHFLGFFFTDESLCLQTTGSWSYWDKLKAPRPSHHPPPPSSSLSACSAQCLPPGFLLCPFVWLRVSSRWHRPLKLLCFFDLLAGIISVRRAFSAEQLLCLQISKWNILICPPARWQWWIWGGLPAMRVFTWLWSEQICC